MNGLKNVRNRRDDSLARVGWADFEALLAEFYRRRGYRVEHVGTGGTGARFDGGIDLKLRKNDEFIVVQCKHWNARQVPHNDVHQLLGIMVNEGASGAILISSGEFTAYAKAAAARHGHVQLIDGDALRAMIGPLPESMVAPSDSGSQSNLVMPTAGERLLLATQARIRGSKVPRSPYAPLIGGVMFLMFVAVAWVLLQNALEGVTTSMAPLTTRTPASMVQPHASLQSLPTAPIIAVSAAAATALGNRHVSYGAVVPTSDAKMREWKRKNAESMKILDRTTPQMNP